MADEVNDSHDEAILLLEEELDRICPNLYFDKHHSACCPKYGWMDIVKKMSLKLEMLNKQLKRYGVRTAIQQCKDKFGSLRVYVDTQSMMPAYARLVSAMLEKLHILLDKHLDYKMTTVIDLPSYVNILEEQIDDVEYDYCKDTTSANVRYVERDGKFFRQGAYKRMRSSHDEATRHVIMHTLSMKLHDMAMKVQRWTQRK